MIVSMVLSFGVSLISGSRLQYGAKWIEDSASLIDSYVCLACRFVDEYSILNNWLGACECYRIGCLVR